MTDLEMQTKINFKECQICGCSMYVQYWKVKIDNKIMDICPGCKKVYRKQLEIITST